MRFSTRIFVGLVSQLERRFVGDCLCCCWFCSLDLLERCSVFYLILFVFVYVTCLYAVLLSCSVSLFS